jgi:O-methyltransferase
MNLQKALTNAYWRTRLSETARAVLRARLTYLSPAKLYNLEQHLALIDRAGVEGDCLEFGVALGGSAIVIARRMAPGRRFIGYDRFGTIPPPSERDDDVSHERYGTIASGCAQGIGGDLYYGYELDLLHKVMGNFAAFGLTIDGDRFQLIEGFFEDTVSFGVEMNIAFAHVDCDWHDPVAFCLEQIYPRLAVGGFVILDDYNSYGGCRKATDVFLGVRKDMRLLEVTPHAILVRG